MTETSIRLENELELKKRFQRLRGAAAAMDGWLSVDAAITDEWNEIDKRTHFRTSDKISVIKKEAARKKP